MIVAFIIPPYLNLTLIHSGYDFFGGFFLHLMRQVITLLGFLVKNYSKYFIFLFEIHIDFYYNIMFYTVETVF